MLIAQKRTLEERTNSRFVSIKRFRMHVTLNKTYRPRFIKLRSLRLFFCFVKKKMDIDDPVELHDIIHVSDELRQELVDKHIEPFYVETVKSALYSNLFWKRTAILAETKIREMHLL